MIKKSEVVKVLEEMRDGFDDYKSRSVMSEAIEKIMGIREYEDINDDDLK